MIKIIESKITNPKINSNRELIFSVRIKREDYDNELWEDICSLADNWTPVAIWMEWVSEFNSQPTIWEKRSKLASLMIRYSELIKTDPKTQTQKLYDKYNITSRTQLTETQLDEEIKVYQAWLQEFYN